MLLAVLAFVVAGFALLRYVVGIPLLMRYFRRARVSGIPKGPTPPLSLLKPLYDRDPGLQENLVATLRQNYPEFEVLFLHERPDDPALVDVWNATTAVTDVPTRLIPGRDPEAANPKVAVLLQGEAAAQHDILVSADSDIRPDPLYLRDVANALADADAVCFPPVMFGMQTMWSRAAALAVNTDGLLGVIMTNGEAMIGATIGVRREALQRIGGWRTVADRIADDYSLGEELKKAGCKLALARRAARLYHPGGDLRETASWIVRWARTIRVSVPGWYLFALATAFAPVLLLATALFTPYVAPALWVVAALTGLRALVAVAVDLRFCWDRSLVRGLWLLPLLWFAEPAGMVVAFFGRTVTWRGRRYRISGGRATLLDS